MNPIARGLRSMVRGYQHLRAGRPSPCRYEPSCSSYAVEALELHGARHGSWLALRRLLRCGPWGGHGWDPVPLRSTGDAAPPAHDATSLADRSVA